MIFAIDISGSMRGKKIETVKKVMSKTIEEIRVNHPDRKVGIVLFESAVHIYGDGTKNMIKADNIDNYDFIVKTGLACGHDML